MTAKDRFIRHLLICFVLFLAFALIALFSPSIHLGCVGLLALLVFGTLFTAIGVFVGDTFRRFVRPDAFWTHGAVDTFTQKLFWLYGPQVIGWFIGWMALNGFMHNVLHIAM